MDTVNGMWRGIDRRTFLIGAGASGALAACGGNEVTTGSGVADRVDSEVATTPDRLAPRFPDGFRAPSAAVVGHGLQRFPFIVVAQDQLPMLSETAPLSVDIEVVFNGETITTESVDVRGLGQFTPFYPLEFEPPEAGSYIARTEFSEFDFEFLVVERADTGVFQVGEQLPAFDTPTFDDPRGVDPISTRPGGPSPFHEITLTEALSNGRPTALLIATPEFCQTDVCGPSLEFLIEHADGRSDINIIHQEVFANFQRDADSGAFPELAPLLLEWDWAFEPSMYVMDENGTIVGGKHFAFDSDEVAELLNLI